MSSWFTEIAGKAEDLLNKVDKTAATALQNKIKYGSSNDIRLNSNPSPKLYDTSFSSFNSKSSNLASSGRNSPISGNTKKNTNSLPRKKSKNDDEKLLQFLNSDEPVFYLSNEKLPSPKKTMSSELQSSLDQHSSPAVKQDTSTVSNNSSVANADLAEIVQAIEQKDVHMPECHIIEEQLQKSSDVPEVLVIPSASSSSDETEIAQFEIVEKVNSDDPFEDISKLKKELLLANEKAMYADAEMKRMQKKLDHWNSQISGNDKMVRELQEREKDFRAELDAKNTQLAVLKVRLEEVDEEVKNKRLVLEALKQENEQSKKDHANEMTMQKQICESLKIKLSELEEELSKSKEAYRVAQNEHMAYMGKLEEQQKQLAENVTKYQRKWTEVNERNKELLSQMQNSNRNMESLQHEYSEYKIKAQRILQTKEKLIEDLKKGNLNDENSNESYNMLSAETEGIRQERDLLREELRQANELIETLRTEIQTIERLSQNDSEAARQHTKNLEDQLHQERLLSEEIQLQNVQLKEEILVFKDELQRSRTNLQSRIQDRDMEIEKLRKQLTTKSMSTVSQDELESRLHALTENLIQKQTIVEGLSTEKNSLVLQLERVEQQLKEAQQYASQFHNTSGLNNNDNDRKVKQAMVFENPFDSSLTRKVKKMYSSIDTFSIRLGVFFRRYPLARVFLIVYMLLLHFWVMIVLLTYEPEIHHDALTTVYKR